MTGEGAGSAVPRGGATRAATGGAVRGNAPAELEGPGADKAALRARLVAARVRRASSERVKAGQALVAALRALPELASARTVAAYAPVGSEPGPPDLGEVLAEGGRRVLLPVLLPDNDLDWAAYDGPASVVAAGRGLREPGGRRLGPGAVADADVVVVPGLAVDRNGMRLGRGGGSYDRALARAAGAFTVVLLYDGELLDHVPAEPHDRRVGAAVTPGGTVRF